MSSGKSAGGWGCPAPPPPSRVLLAARGCHAEIFSRTQKRAARGTSLACESRTAIPMPMHRTCTCERARARLITLAIAPARAAVLHDGDDDDDGLHTPCTIQRVAQPTYTRLHGKPARRPLPVELGTGLIRQCRKLAYVLKAAE